ncbi:MAG: pyridoxal phosphate-dependent aminotransferase [Tissierellia bacterium]|nr:pyridoxal phosphate-dependent aminotransferase [Tissierellia bacterium]
MYDFDKVIKRVGTNSYKWDMVAREYDRDDLLPMWIADMDFEIAPEIIQAVKKRADHKTYGYTYPSDNFYDSIIKWNEKRNSYHVKREWMNVSTGVVPSIKAAIYGFTEKEDKILIQTPVYPPFHRSITQAKREIVTSPLIFDGNNYTIDFQDFENKIKSGVKLFILCNPHNPIGRVWTKEELSKMTDLCYENNVKILSDEIHSDIILKGYKHTVINTVSEKAKNISLVCQSPSKTFNIAGLSTSFIIVENEVLRKQMWDSAAALGIDSVNLFGLTAVEAAYTYGEKWLDEMLLYIEANGEFVVNYIKEKLPKIKTYKPQATYLMWLDFRACNLSQGDLMNKLINGARVVLNSGTDFGEEGQGFVRLNIGCSKAMLKECLDRIYHEFH